MENEKEIRYFSMFTGVGGFEKGFERSSELFNKELAQDREKGQEQNSEIGDKERRISKSDNNSPKRFSSVRKTRTNDNKPKRQEPILEKNKSDTTIKSIQGTTNSNGGRITEERIKDDKLLPRINPSNGGRRRTYTCVGVSEIDKYANQVLAKRFPNTPNFGDASKINPSELPDFDLLCGGFPCQSFSIAGKRRGFEDTRGTMFFHIARILEVKKPKLVLLENVKGLLNHEKGKTFSTIIQTMEELGYDVQWMVLNSKFFGVPQNRERVFIIGSARGERRSEILPFRKSNGELDEKSIQKLCGSSPSPIFTVSDSERTRREIQSRYSIRRLTPKECERLQSFPDNWTLIKQDNGKMMSDTQRYKMMGNAVTVNVIKALGDKLNV